MYDKTGFQENNEFENMINENEELKIIDLAKIIKFKHKSQSVDYSINNSRFNKNYNNSLNINEKFNENYKKEKSLSIPKINMTIIKQKQEFNKNYEKAKKMQTKYQKYNSALDKNLFSNSTFSSKYTSKIKKKIDNEVFVSSEFSDLKFSLDYNPKILSRFERKK